VAVAQALEQLQMLELLKIANKLNVGNELQTFSIVNVNNIAIRGGFFMDLNKMVK